MPRALLLMAALAFAPVVCAQRPPIVVPGDPQQLIDRLPRGYARLMPTALPSPSATATAVSVARIQQLLASSALTGDARLAARADALLARLPATSRDPDVLLARAFSAQHRHDFTAAVALLDAAITQSPRNAAARLSRAQVQIVRGRLDLARADCTALVLGIDGGSGLLCAGMLSLRSGHYDAAAAVLDRWLQDSSPADERRRYALVMRAEVAARAHDHTVDSWFRRALALAPDDVRTLAAYARYLRGAGRDREVTSLIAAQTSHDGLQLQRALAAYRLDPRAAAPLVAAQARRFAVAHAAGSPVELRDEAEFLLFARHDAVAALALAQRNFDSQRDFEDVALLQCAAVAARRPEALRPLQAWAATQHLTLSPTPEAAR